METEINEVYTKIDKIFKIRLKAQLEGSQIFFKRFLHVEDLIKNEKYFVLIVNKEGIHFTNLRELYIGLKNVIVKELKEIEKEEQDYQVHKRNDMVYDEVFIDYELDGLGYKGKKLWQILTQIEKNLIKIENLPSKDIQI